MLQGLRRSAAEFLYTERRHVFRVLRGIGYSRRRALVCSLARLGEHKALLRDSGLRLMMYREHRDPWDRTGECYFGKNHLSNPVRCVVDVGAHTGSFSRACGLLLQPAVIHCFEPNADLLPALGELRELLPGTKVNVHHAAVGAHAGSLVFRKVANPLLNSPLAFNRSESEMLAAYDSTPSGEIEVAQVTLDEALQGVPEIDLLKVDTQGFEMNVFAGAPQTLAKTRVLMVESNFLSIYEGGSTFSDVHRFLNDAGFVLVQFDAPSRTNGAMVWTDALYVARRLVTPSPIH